MYMQSIYVTIQMIITFHNMIYYLIYRDDVMKMNGMLKEMINSLP